MDMYDAKIELFAAFKNSLTPDRSKKGYICPVCGSGSGNKGTGITENKRSPYHYTCWAGCFTNADAIEIIAIQEGLEANSAEAIKRAYELYGIEAAAPGPERKREPVKKIEPAELPEEEETDYTGYYAECRKRLDEQAAKDYLSYRGISKETAEKYWLGYDANWQSPTALKAGKNPPKSARLIIPTSRTSYIARAIESSGEYSKLKAGKTKLFNSKALYNEEERPVFITEGEIDALSVIECGGLACALGSTSNVKKLLEALRERPTNATLIISLDNDEPGEKAATELVKGLQALGIKHIKVNISGEHKDENEALQKDKNSLLEAIKKAEAKTSNKPDSVAAYIENLMSDEIEKFKAGSNRKTGFKALDEATGGIYSGLYAIGAISSLGKTTFIHQIADQMAAAGNDVLYFSLEQSRLEMVSKSIARKSAQLDMKTATTSLKIRQGNLPEATLKAAEEYSAAVKDHLSIIEGNFNCDIDYICDYVRDYITRTDTRPVVIVDYLQILQGNKQQTAKEIIDSNVTELKRLSRSEDIPVFVISSFNRDNYLAPVDFKSFNGSGNIEYTADVVWGLQLLCINEDLFTSKEKITEKRNRIKEAKNETPRKIQLVCLKNRYGISSYTFSFDYYPAHDLFVEESDYRPAPADFDIFG